MSRLMTTEERSEWLHKAAQEYFKWRREAWPPLMVAEINAWRWPNKMCRVRPGKYVVLDELLEGRYLYLCYKVRNEWLVVRIDGGRYELRGGSERTLKDILISFEIPF